MQQCWNAPCLSAPVRVDPRSTSGVRDASPMRPSRPLSPGIHCEVGGNRKCSTGTCYGGPQKLKQWRVNCVTRGNLYTFTKLNKNDDQLGGLHPRRSATICVTGAVTENVQPRQTIFVNVVWYFLLQWFTKYSLSVDHSFQFFNSRIQLIVLFGDSTTPGLWT